MPVSVFAVNKELNSRTGEGTRLVAESMPAVASRVTGLTVLLAVHASTTQSSTDALQAELALARSTLASVRALVPRLQVATASELTAPMHMRVSVCVCA